MYESLGWIVATANSTGLLALSLKMNFSMLRQQEKFHKFLCELLGEEEEK